MQLGSRWGRWTGVAVMTVAAVAAVQATAAADTFREGPPPGCAGPPVASGGTGTWFRLDPVLAEGTLVGQRAVIGRADGGGWAVDLPTEAFVAAPRGGLILVGADDGRTSTVTMVDAVSGCAWPAATATDVIRGAVLAPDGRTWFEHRLRRADRLDLGVWFRDPRAGTARRILPPLAADGRFGITWSTRLLWSEDGRRLVVQTCGEVACRTRVVDPTTGTVRTIADPRFGRAVGLAGDRLVLRDACLGLPCAVVAMDLATDAAVRLVDEAGGATLAVDSDGRAAVVYDTGRRDAHLRAADLVRGTMRDLGPLADGQRVIGPSLDAGRETPAGTIVLVMDDEGAAGRRDDPAPMPAMRRLTDLAAAAAADTDDGSAP